MLLNINLFLLTLIFFLSFISLLLSNFFNSFQSILTFDLFLLYFIIYISSLIVIYLNTISSIFFFLECISYSTIIYFSTFINKKNNKIILIYFIYSCLCTLIFFLFISIYYYMFQTLDLYIWYNIIFFLNPKSFNSIYILYTLFGIYFIFKLGIGPFFWYTPEIYYISSYNLLNLYTINIKLIFLLILLKLNFSTIIMYAGVGSIVIGSVLGVQQNKIKPLLAFSGISHLGFIVICICIDNTIINLNLLYIYLFFYFLTMISFWTYISFISPHSVFLLELNNCSSFIKIIWTFFFLTLTGFPPFLGFYIKFYVLKILLYKGYIACSIIAFMFSISNAFFYIHLLSIIYSFHNNSFPFLYLNPFNIKDFYLFFLFFFTGLMLFINIFYIFIWFQSNPFFIIELIINIK